MVRVSWCPVVSCCGRCLAAVRWADEMPRLGYGLFSVHVPDDWSDITADLEPDAPITVARTGVTRVLCSFQLPRTLVPRSLAQVLEPWCNCCGTSPGRAISSAQAMCAPVPTHSCSPPRTSLTRVCHSGLVRFGCANFALVTHTKQEFDAEEIGVAEAIVRSLLWTSTSRPRRLDS